MIGHVDGKNFRPAPPRPALPRPSRSDFSSFRHDRDATDVYCVVVEQRER